MSLTGFWVDRESPGVSDLIRQIRGVNGVQYSEGDACYVSNSTGGTTGGLLIQADSQTSPVQYIFLAMVADKKYLRPEFFDKVSYLYEMCEVIEIASPTAAFPITANSNFTAATFDGTACNANTNTSQVIFTGAGATDDLTGGQVYIPELGQQRYIIKDSVSGGIHTLTVGPAFSSAPTTGNTLRAVPWGPGYTGGVKLQAVNPQSGISTAVGDKTGGPLYIYDVNLDKRIAYVRFSPVIAGGGAGNPGGSNGQIQFNSGGSFGGFTASGDASINTGTGAVTLANTTVTPGSYTSVNLTVDSKGRITSAASGGGGGAVSSVAAADSSVTVSPTTGAVLVSLPVSGATAGSYTLPNLTINGKGIITNISSGAGAAYATYSPTQFERTRLDLAAVKAGSGYAYYDIWGDSTTAAAGFSSNIRYTSSVPAVLQTIFRAAGMPSAEGFVVPTATDDRWTLGADWSASNAGVGNSNSAFTAPSGTTLLTFAPGHNFTNLDIYVIKGGGLGTFQVDIDGGSIGTVNTTTGGTGSGTVACYSFTGIANANHTIAFHAPGGTGAVTIVGVQVWDANVKSVLISNMGINGTTSGNWTSTGSLDIIKTRILKGVKCFIGNIGINDAVNSLPGASIGPFNTNMATITGVMTGADIALQTSVPSDPAFSAGAGPNEVAQAASVISMTQINNWGLIDINARFVSYAVSNPLGYYADQLHPSLLGYNDIAQGYFDAIGKYNGPAAVNTVTNTDGSITVAPNFGPVVVGLPTQGGVAGNYTSANLTINSKGIITAAASGAGGSGSGQVFPAFNLVKTRATWSLMNSSYGGVNLVMTPAVIFNQTGTASLGFPEIASKYTSAASSGSAAGITSGGVTTYFSQLPQLFTRIITGPTATNCRYWIGMSGGNEAGNATPANPGLFFGYDTGVDGTAFWRIVSFNGTSATRTATSVAFAASTEYQFAIDYSVAGSAVFYINGTAVGTLTTNLPVGVTDAVTFQTSVTTLAAVAQVIELRHSWLSSL